MNKQRKQPSTASQVVRPIEKLFSEFNSEFGQGNKALYVLFLILAAFGIMGLVWMIPFPQFDFLVKMKAHTFLNWGSFFIAIIIYSYLRLAPTLSYAVLFCIGIMSFFIVQLEYVERDGGPSVVLVCGIIALIGLVGLYLVLKSATPITFSKFIKFLAISPVWLWSKVFDQLKWKY